MQVTLLTGSLVALVIGYAATAAEPVAEYSFDTPGQAGRDTSGHGHDALVTAAEIAPGQAGNGLLLDGRGGLEVASAHALHAAGEFTLECWVRFTSTSDNMNIISKDGEYLLRVDPANEGSNISFYVNANGSLEPRARGPKASEGVWYHIVATWDGSEAVLWVNGEEHTSRRAGRVAPADSPLLIARPSRYGPVGLKGLIDQVRLYDRALAAGEVLVREYGLDKIASGPATDTARFEFAAGPEGWAGNRELQVTAAGGKLCAEIPGETALLVRRGLAVSIGDAQFITLRMAVSAGSQGKVLFITDQGPAVLSFPLKSDGQMHSYVLDASVCPEWSGTLTDLGVAPANAQARVELDFVRVCATPEAPPEIAVTSFLARQVISRARRPCQVVATIRNTGGEGRDLVARLEVPPGVTPAGPIAQHIPVIAHDETQQVSWDVHADAAGAAGLRVTISGEEMAPTHGAVQMVFAPALELPPVDYVPEPQAAPSQYLVGAHYCPLWMQGSRSSGWELIEPYPEREPALGWYDEDNPEVTDWEIKWALEHGISFFVYCWYRVNQGHEVETRLSHAIHSGLFRARYGSRFRFCIMWENQWRGQAGVASEEDFLTNLVPFWIENYFKHPSYLKVDNKPLLFIYRPEYLVDDLGSVENVRRALDKAREACMQAGFAGLTILGEYRGMDPAPLQLMAQEGLDYSFAYCWPVGGNPTPPVAIDAQQAFWRQWQRLGIIPGLLTISMGWDSTPWHPTYTAWRLPPEDFRILCERAKGAMAQMPADSLGRKMVLLDNWNEFGEGHYIAPHRQYGFGYLDAVRAVFTRAPEPHVDVVPEDVGLGPYDSRYREFRARREECAKRVMAEAGAQPGVLAYWSFDEPQGTTWAYDWSGHGLGAIMEDAQRGDGHHGHALVCAGGSATVPGGAPRFGLRQITVECWVKTDTPDQHDKWFVNCVYGSGETGFRLGLHHGRLCWAIPKTAWSHHLVANQPLPLGQWTHVLATYDGQMMRLYMNGEECGVLERGGRVRPTEAPLCLGSYEKGHRASFSGLLDEVRIWSRALAPER